MNHRPRFRLLVRIFHERFFENDTVSPGGGFQTNIYQVVGFLVATGWFISYFLMPPFLQLSQAKPTEQIDWTIRTLRLFFTSYSFAITGFATVFEWDMLFPDRRDFLILGTFPIRIRELLVAKLAALWLFLLLLILAINVFPVLMMMALSVLVPSLHGSGARLVVAQVVATGGASLFAFLCVACIQGILISILSPRLFQRSSPWIQMFGMSAMVLSVLLYPLYSILLRPAVEADQSWPWLFPPVWFAGVYELVVSTRSSELVTFGVYGLTLLGIVATLTFITWACGYGRHYRRTLESEEFSQHINASMWPMRLIRCPGERAIAEFSIKTLARSRKHRLFLSTYISVGLSFGTLFALAVRSGKLELSQDGLRAFPFLIVFFVISGFRAVCQFPADLPANWIFRLSEARSTEAARRAIRRHVVFGGLIPALVFLLPLELALWDWPVGFLHCAFQLLTGALLVEAMFWTFDKIPFTCSYFPGNMNLSLLAGLYLYGFTTYSFHLADVERWMETHWSYAALAFTVCGLLLAVSWLRRAPSSTVRFDADEPVIRTLDLT